MREPRLAESPAPLSRAHSLGRRYSHRLPAATGRPLSAAAAAEAARNRGCSPAPSRSCVPGTESWRSGGQRDEEEPRPAPGSAQRAVPALGTTAPGKQLRGPQHPRSVRGCSRASPTPPPPKLGVQAWGGESRGGGGGWNQR